MAEYFDEVVLDAGDLEKLFQAATEFVRTMHSLSDEKKLAFYALYKQVSPLNFLVNALFVSRIFSGTFCFLKPVRMCFCHHFRLIPFCLIYV